MEKHNGKKYRTLEEDLERKSFVEFLWNMFTIGYCTVIALILIGLAIMFVGGK